MTNSLFTDAPIVPLVQADDPGVAIEIVEALKAGGLRVIEVVMRTDAAMEAMDAIIKGVSDVVVGAGTILTADQASQALDLGAEFIVSPGLHADVVAKCKDHGKDIYPGVVTPSEVQLAWNLGLTTVKFFPAGLSGGPGMLKALSSVFRHMKFMPTGGVSAGNLADYLAVPSVVACGGSWLTPATAIKDGEFSAITTLAREAVSIAKTVR